jgi:hypothetical protein
MSLGSADGMVGSSLDSFVEGKGYPDSEAIGKAEPDGINAEERKNLKADGNNQMALFRWQGRLDQEKGASSSRRLYYQGFAKAQKSEE